MTWHRFIRLGDLSPKQRRVQRRGVLVEAMNSQCEQDVFTGTIQSNLGRS